MRAIFSNRGFILVWVFIMAIIALSIPLTAVAQQLRAAKLDVELSQWLATVNQIAPKIIDAVFQYVNPPQKITFPGGFLQLETKTVFVVIGGLFILIGVVLHRRAVRSESGFDDFIALVILYVFLQAGTGIWVKQSIMPRPLQAGFLATVMTLLVIYFTLRGGGFEDSRIFFRSALQIYIIWLFLFPLQTLGFTLGALERLAGLGQGVNLPPAFGIWAVIGLMIALPMLYTIGTKARSKPAPRPSSGPPPAAAKQNQSTTVSRNFLDKE